jgi:hypothetical protein
VVKGGYRAGRVNPTGGRRGGGFDGPPFRKFGKTVTYRWGDALAWAEARTSPARVSTAAQGDAGRKKSMPGPIRRVPRATRRWPARRRSGAYRARQTMKLTYLFEAAAALKRRIEATPSGMAYLSGTGPPRTVCEECSFYGYSSQYPNSCYRYYLLMRQHGAPLPIATPSCQHF